MHADCLHIRIVVSRVLLQSHLVWQKMATWSILWHTCWRKTHTSGLVELPPPLLASVASRRSVPFIRGSSLQMQSIVTPGYVLVASMMYVLRVARCLCVALSHWRRCAGAVETFTRRARRRFSLRSHR